METIGPKPWTSFTRLSQVSVHRKLDCPLYVVCLSEASLLEWESFTCVYCPMKKGDWEKKYDTAVFSTGEEHGGLCYETRTAQETNC